MNDDAMSNNARRHAATRSDDSVICTRQIQLICMHKNNIKSQMLQLRTNQYERQLGLFLLKDTN